MYSDTLWPGSWPPSPGFAPCAILICIWSADEVLRGHAEAAGGHLLDLRAQAVARRSGKSWNTRSLPMNVASVSPSFAGGTGGSIRVSRGTAGVLAALTKPRSWARWPPQKSGRRASIRVGYEHCSLPMYAAQLTTWQTVQRGACLSGGGWLHCTTHRGACIRGKQPIGVP